MDLANAGYTHIIVAFSVFNTRFPGQLTPAFDTVSKNYIKSLQSYGIKVMLSIGGPTSSIPNTSVNFHSVLLEAASPKIFQDTMIDSLEYFLQDYGFDGFDFDIEQGIDARGSFEHPLGDIAMLVNIINTLHSRHPKLLLSLAPQVENVTPTSSFKTVYGNYASLIMKTHEALSWVGVQLYNSGCAYGLDNECYEPKNINTPDFYVAVATDLLTNWPQKTKENNPTHFQPYLSYLTPSQVVLGFYIPTVKNDLPTVPFSVIKRAMRCLNTAIVADDSCGHYIPPKAYQYMGGIFGWQVTSDAHNQYKFAANLKNCALNYQCN